MIKKKKSNTPMERINLGAFEVAFTDYVIELRAKKSLDMGKTYVKNEWWWKERLETGTDMFFMIGSYIADYIKAIGAEDKDKQAKMLKTICLIRFTTFSMIFQDKDYFEHTCDLMNKRYADTETKLQGEMPDDEWEAFKTNYLSNEKKQNED